MIRNIIVVFLLFTGTSYYRPVVAQEIYTNSQFGLSVTKPEGWRTATDSTLRTNLRNLNFTPEELQKVLNTNKGVLSLCTYYKYPIDSVSGLIPTAKITVRTNPTTTFNQFLQAATGSIDRTKTILKNFAFIDSIKEVTISGYPALYYSSRYSLPHTSGEEMQIRNQYYLIPRKNYYISISLMDNEINEDCSQVYEKLKSSLKLGK